MTVKASTYLLIAAQVVLVIAYALPILSSDRLKGSDFAGFYTGWAIVADGQGPRLYDLELQRAYQAQVVGNTGHLSDFKLLPFVYPPHAALALMPFAYLPARSAVYVYLALNCLIAAWVLYRLWQLAEAWRPSERTLLITTTLATEVLWYGLGIGAMTLFVFASLLEYYLALRAGRDTRAAVWLIVATIKPQLILLPALIPLVQRRWRLIGIAASLGLLVGLIVSLSLGFHVWLDYWGLLRGLSRQGERYGAFTVLMDNLRMILYWTAPSSAVIPLTYLAFFAGAAGTYWLWRSARHFDLRFALTVLLSLFLAPYLHYQDTLVAIFPAALGYDFVRTKRPRLLPGFQLIVLAATFVPAVLIFTGYGRRAIGWVWPLPLIMILTAVCAHSLRREET